MCSGQSILDLLTTRNPEIVEGAPGSKSLTSHHMYHWPKQLKKWDEFSFETLETLYEGSLIRVARERASPLPALPHLSQDADCVVGDEDATQHVFTKWNHTIVQAALDEVREPFHSCVWTPGRRHSRAGARFTPTRHETSASEQPGRTACGRLSRKNFKPDAGAFLPCRTHGSSCAAVPVERLPKDYKTAAKWNSSILFQGDILDESGRWRRKASRKNEAMPIRQAFTYCIHFRCRYGCILTTDEAFIFRIRPRAGASYTPESALRGDDALERSLREDGLMEYVSIPWASDETQDADSDGTLTVNLALWLVHILAGNHHEVDWSYCPLASETLATKACPAGNAPRTPESQVWQPSLSRARPELRSASRKRRRSDTDDAVYYSFSKGHASSAQGSDRSSTEESQSSDGDSASTVDVGGGTASGNARKGKPSPSPQSRAPKLRRSERGARYL
ncbi:hypothetical protein CDD83_365 [Cordyceps sp. RAO-2017]|nr:hypothetical protein CDD83_365 [Cordyceps sp. RAO-2017]